MNELAPWWDWFWVLSLLPTMACVVIPLAGLFVVAGFVAVVERVVERRSRKRPKKNEEETPL